MIWAQLCKYVSECKRANQKEKDFENKIDLFFQAYLGWKELNHDLERQVKIEFAHTRGYADIILFCEGKEEIIIELKKPNNVQIGENIRQLTDYMKQKRCNFGLYIGEKLELYYDEDDKSKKRVDPVLVSSIDFVESSKEGTELVALLSRDSYCSDTLEEYCQRKIKLTQVAKYWSSKEGVNRIYQYILSHSQLPETLIDNLASLLSINITLNENKEVKVIEESNIVPIEQPKNLTNKVANESEGRDKTLYSLDGVDYVGKSRFVLVLTKAIMQRFPAITYQELKEILPLHSNYNHTLLTKDRWLSGSDDARKRYCRKEGDLLRDVNGVEFYVSTQWTKQGIDEKILPIAKQYNLKVYVK